MSDSRIALIIMTSCSNCPHKSPGFLSEPATCVWGERKKDPYEFLCDMKKIPAHCPLPVTGTVECAELRKDALRAIEAWDVTVLPKGRDGRMQEAMECLRFSLGEKP